MNARNRHLIAKAAGANELLTPALVIDLDKLERNIANMAAWAKNHRIGLRPHAKTHKSPDIAKRQIAAGANGICCATVKELEVLGKAGIPGLLLTTGVAPNKATWIAAINKDAEDLSVVVDHPDYLDALSGAAEASGKVLQIKVDIDPSLGRTGVTDTAMAVQLAQTAAAHPWLEYDGVQAYMGHLQHIAIADERRQKIERDMAGVDRIIAALQAANLNPAIVTGAGTGTHRIDQAMGRYTELQVGSYVFMDVDYNAIDISLAGDSGYETSLFVQTTAVNVNHPTYAVTDAGLKSFATDGPMPKLSPDCGINGDYRFMGDEHGRLTYSDGQVAMKIGDLARCVVSHCDPTVNLYDYYHVIQGDTLVDIWPVAARGNN